MVEVKRKLINLLQNKEISHTVPLKNIPLYSQLIRLAPIHRCWMLWWVKVCLFLKLFIKNFEILHFLHHIWILQVKCIQVHKLGMSVLHSWHCPRNMGKYFPNLKIFHAKNCSKVLYFDCSKCLEHLSAPKWSCHLTLVNIAT